MKVALVFQLIGVLGVILVIATHIAERFRLFPSMGWGLPDSPGHYLDLAGASAALLLLPIGYALRRITKHRISH